MSGATASSLQSIECSDQPLDLSFHPQLETLVAAALVDGTLEVHDFKTIVSTDSEVQKDIDASDSEDEDDTILSSTPVHTQLVPNPTDATKQKNAACRTVKFSQDGRYVYTGGSAGDLVCVNAERACTFSTTNVTNDTIVWKIDHASVGTSHTNPVHVLSEMPPACSKGPLIVSGDDHGGVRLWDQRLCDITTNNNNNNNNNSNNKVSQSQQTLTGPLKLPKGCVLSWKQQSDYISALLAAEDGNTLLSTSADGTLCVFDIRQASTNNILQNQHSCVRKSDPQDDELLSIAILKQGKKVVVGTQEGVLAIWSWGTWGDISDRYPQAHNGHSVDAMLEIDDATIITGSSDGLLRVVSIQPNKVIGALGDHNGFPIESLQYSAQKKWVGSVGHDPHIRLWDTKILHEDSDDEEDGDEEVDNQASQTRTAVPAAAAAAPNQGRQASDDEWEDMDEGDDDQMNENCSLEKDSDDSDDDDDAPGHNDARSKRFKSRNEEFFADL